MVSNQQIIKGLFENSELMSYFCTIIHVCYCLNRLPDMKNRCSCPGSIGWIRMIAVLVVLASLSLSLSCGRKAASNQESSRCASFDSVMMKINDVDSLAAMADFYHKQGDAEGEMVALLYKGRCLRQHARYEEAMATLNHGLKVANHLHDTIGEIMGLIFMGDVNDCLGELSNANGCYYQALALCEMYHDQDRMEAIRAKAMVLNGIGNIEYDLCNLTAADSVLHKSLALEEQLGRNKGIAVNYCNLGQVKQALNDQDSAWFFFRKSMEYHQLSGSVKGQARCHYHYGEMYENENNFSHAIKEYTIAYEELKKTGDPWQWLRPCLALARVYILMGDAEKAHRFVEECETEANSIGCKSILADACMAHYELSLLQGNSQEALQHYTKSIELHDSIYGLKKTDEMRAQRIAYQNGRKFGEMNSLNRDINHLKRNRKMQTLFMTLLLLMAGAIIAALVYAMRVRLKTQRLMRQVEETRSLFFTNVVPQLRTPLTAIMGAVDSIMAEARSTDKDDSYSARLQDSGEIIERQGKNLLTLVDRILEVGSVRSAITDLDWQTGDVVIFMHMIVESFRERCLERHIELTYASREKSVEIDAVPRYMVTIVANLIENAINYSRDFCKITVTSQVEGGMFILRVADNGMGIDKKDLPHVFEPFYRSADAEPLVEGVGIGLTVVRDMAMAMGGVVAADSMKGHGSVFTVELLCKRGKDVEQRFDDAIEPLIKKVRKQQRYRQGSIEPNSSTGNLPVVLVVEDHIDVARLVGHMIGDHYDVRYATDGKQGLTIAGDCVPDLIITDVKMPLMDGIEMCRQLRQSRKLCHIPVMMLSARNAEADRVRGIEAGADAYLVKPFVSEELKAWVDHLINNRQLLRKVFAQPHTRIEQQESEPTQPIEDNASFLLEFAREVDKQFVSGGKIDMDKVALSFKMGESQLKRKIQTLTGKNVSAYIIQLRMEKAMRLLQESSPETLISTIAEQCGFLDVAYFSRVFRQYYGMTPSQARSKN